MSKFKVAKSLFGKAVDALKGDGKNKFSPSGASASNRTPTPPKPKTPKTPKTATSPTSAPMPKKPVTPKVNKPKTPPKTPKAETPKKPTSGKSTPKRVVDVLKTAAGRGTPGARSRVDQTVSKLEEKVGLGKQGQRRGVSKRDQEIAKNVRNVASTTAKIGTGTGLGYGAKTLYDSIENRPNNKNINTTKANKNKAPFVEGYDMDMDDFDSPKPSYPRPPKAAAKPAKAAKQADDGYKFYGKEDSGLGDFSRKFGIKYATQEQYDKDFDTHDGEKRGGRPGKGKMKTQGLNRSKRSGFSGRGTGAALRGF